MARKPRRRRREEESGLSAREKLTRALEIPNAILPNTAHIELLGNREAVIDGCKGILIYKEDEIKLNLGSKVLRFVGSGMEMNTLNGEQASIQGTILSMEFLS